ncbi:MAG: glycogen/starch/alpha-glucan phosphorylase [Eubacteriales bacterium]|nr:glycogen/starch/alpha-glucan phosphorylase [Eubacteriales bacterium]
MLYGRMTTEEIKESILGKIEREFGCEITDATSQQIWQAIAMTVRDEVMERRAASRGVRKKEKAKKVYYLSAEFLVGRALHNNMINLVNEKNYIKALEELNIPLPEIFEQETDPGLGNGGLGRLAACFLDSLTALQLPAMGCSIRYEYGLFRQKIVDGCQVEMPDNWLANGNVWEICRPDQTVEVHFGGYIQPAEENGKTVYQHLDYKTVQAVPYEMPVLGYDSSMVNMLRLWSAHSVNSIDMFEFNRGQYVRAMEERELAEVISKVLYPEDTHREGRELRLKQQYFFSSASIQYAVKDFVQVYGSNFSIFPDKVAIQINDTHPAVAIPELMRILMDEHGLGWEEAEDICRRTFSYTNHTIMSEALERWSEDMFRNLLPRIYMILEEMNKRLCAKLWEVYPGQWERIGHMAILAYGQVHMANLCVSSCHAVNGVSKIHTDILRKQTFHDFHVMEPGKIHAITNGITHRRWLMQANTALADLLDEAIGQGWRAHPEELSKLMPFAEDAAFRAEFAKVKKSNKARLAAYMQRTQGAILRPDDIFDSQAKRLHEYKRQLMNVLSIMVTYNRIVDNPNLDMPPRTFLFGAKSAPGYGRAKLIIQLINAVSELIKKHPRASQLLNVVFLENYNVSNAELLIPATEISEQISTAGKEASGTGNMKFMMNGALTIGTLDGANVEMSEAVGMDNIFIFGMRLEEVERAERTYRASEVYETNVEIRRALEMLIDGTLCPEDPRKFQDLYHTLLFGDFGGRPDQYFVLKDLPDYLRAQNDMLNVWKNPDKWWAMAVRNTASSGVFASDRSIAEYNEKIWHLKPLEL